MDDDDPDTAALRTEQAERARAERRAAEATGDDQHDRRAERAAYLASKLAERERSEQEAQDG